MSEHIALIRWTASGDGFLSGQYSREHTWTFDGGVVVPASPSPAVVREPWSNPANVDPEEAFVASVSSCHMLTYLFLASRAGFAVERYEDAAVGVMTRNERGVPWVSRITLHPRIAHVGSRIPSATEVEHLHHQAHEQCFIANSIRTEVVVI
jgi:organic hydroperoxide reductase OsmC/OhrA